MSDADLWKDEFRSMLHSRGIGHLADFAIEVAADLWPYKGPTKSEAFPTPRKMAEEALRYVMIAYTEQNLPKQLGIDRPGYAETTGEIASVLLYERASHGPGSLEVAALWLSAHPDWVRSFDTHRYLLGDPGAGGFQGSLARLLKAARAIMSRKQRQASMPKPGHTRKPIPKRQESWPDTFRGMLHGLGHALLADYMVIVTEELMQDAGTRRDYAGPDKLAGELLILITEAGMAFVLPTEVDLTDPANASTRRLADEGAEALELKMRKLIARPLWSDTMEKHLPLLDADPSFRQAVTALVRAAREGRTRPKQQAPPSFLNYKPRRPGSGT